MQIFVRGSWECCSWSPSPASNVSGCVILVYGQLRRGYIWYAKHVSEKTPPNFDGKQTQRLTYTFLVEGVVRDSLMVSDAGVTCMAFQCLLDGVAASWILDHGGQLPNRSRRIQAINYPRGVPMVAVNFGHLLRFNLGSRIVSARSIRIHSHFRFAKERL